MMEFGELLNGGQRLTNERTAVPAIVDLSESLAWRKYIGFSLTGRDANIHADSGVALMPLLDSAVNEESSLAKNTLILAYSMAAKQRLQGEVVWGMAGSGIGLV